LVYLLWIVIPTGVEGPGVSCMNSNGSGTAHRRQLGVCPEIHRRDVS